MFFRFFVKNPLTIWFKRTLKNTRLEYQHKKKKIKIGYMSTLSNVVFGRYNTIYNNVCMTNVKLNDFTYISSDTIINNTKIGKFCSIGPNCRIGLGKHPTKDFVSTHPIFFSMIKQSQISFADKNYFEEFNNIKIGNDVWIGANVVIIDGVVIGDGAIIGAGAVVTKNISPYAIVGGVPAKVITYKFSKEIRNKLLTIKWWDWDIKTLKRNYLKFHNVERFISYILNNNV